MSSKPIHHQPSPVPFHICKQVRETLSEYPNGIEFSSFPRAYQKRFGRWQDYVRLGYSSLRELFRAVPDVTTVYVNNRELAILSSNDRKKPFLNISPSGFSRSNSRYLPSSYPTHPYIAPEDSSLYSEEISTLIVADGTDDLYAQRLSHNQIPLYEKISQEISDLLSGLERTPLEVLETDYQDRYGTELPYIDFGFSSSLELIESLWDTCRLVRVRDSVFVSSIDRDRVRTTDLIVPESRPHRYSRVDPEIGERVRNLLHQWPWGMPVSLLPDKYKNTYREDLPSLELGFEDALSMVLTIPEYVKVTPWTIGHHLVEYILNGLPLTEKELEELNPPSPVKAIPSDYPDIPFDKQPIPPSWEFDVYLSFISNPGKFWIQVVGLKTTTATEHMQEEMTQFYNELDSSNISKYLLSNPREGQSCAAPYPRDGYYYRARILKIPLPDQADVFYVDYGNKSRVPLGSLRRIEVYNMILPTQAIRCRLANVRPASGSQWPSEAMELMKDLTNDMELFCKVQNIMADESLSVHLYDPRSQSGQSINQKLVSDGIAVREKDNAPLHPSRECMSLVENKQIAPHAATLLDRHPPPLPHVHVPWFPPPYPYYNVPPHAYLNPTMPPYVPPTLPHPYMPYNQPHHFIPPYPQPSSVLLPQNSSYISTSVPTPPSYPISNPQLAQPNPYIHNHATLNDRANQLNSANSFDLSREMGTYEKVQKYLSTVKTPEEFELQLQADRARLIHLKKCREDLVTKKFDVSQKSEFDRFLSDINTFTSEINQLENKVSEMLTLSGPNSPDAATPPLPALFQSLLPPTLQPAPPMGVSQNLDPLGQRIQFKYKGIGRGGKMSDLV